MAKQAVITLSELQRAIGKMLKRVTAGEEHLVVVRDGYPIAVMLAYPQYEQLMRERAAAAHRELVIALGQEAERQGLTEEQLIQELEESKRKVHRTRYGRAKP